MIRVSENESLFLSHKYLSNLGLPDPVSFREGMTGSGLQGYSGELSPPDTAIAALERNSVKIKLLRPE
jgi:hypothetical protein